MSTQTPPTPELYFDTIFAFQRSAALMAAIEIELFTAIGDGARAVKDIAKACRTPERATRILCDFLTTLGFLSKVQGAYELTVDSAAFLSKRSPMYLGGTAAFLYSPAVVDRFAVFTETVRRGTPIQNMVAGENPAWVQFAHAMAPMMMPAAHAIADAIDAGSGRPMRVLDIAAGHGMFGIVIAQRNPNAEIDALDWPSVLAVATEHATVMGVGAQHRTLPGDAFTVEYGTGFDVALVTNFVHHFDRPTTVAFLKKTAAALKSGGRIVLLEFVPNVDRVSPPMAARFSLVMLANTEGGDAYTFRELNEMLTEAGFKEAKTYPFMGPEAIIVATK